MVARRCLSVTYWRRRRYRPRKNLAVLLREKKESLRDPPTQWVTGWPKCAGNCGERKKSKPATFRIASCEQLREGCGKTEKVNSVICEERLAIPASREPRSSEAPQQLWVWRHSLLPWMGPQWKGIHSKTSLSIILMENLLSECEMPWRACKDYNHRTHRLNLTCPSPRAEGSPGNQL